MTKMVGINDKRVAPVSFSIDAASLNEFEEAVKETRWLEEIHADNKRSERIRRALRATRIILRTSPAEVRRHILKTVEYSSGLVEKEDVEIEILKKELESLETILLLLAALEELERGRHGGDFKESLALTLRSQRAMLSAGKIREVKKTLDSLSFVLTVPRK